MQLIIITGLSGSGKTVALAALEDAGYYCVDNLPATLIEPLIEQLRPLDQNRIALVADSRSIHLFNLLPSTIAAIREQGVDVRVIFLDARDDILIRRFSETRRKHPLAGPNTTVGEAIAQERILLTPLMTCSLRLDTSDMDPVTCRGWIKSFADVPETDRLTLMIESFGFSKGIPLDADFVFDMRFIKNPHYHPELRPLSGRDEPVARYLENNDTFNQLYKSILRFIETWLPAIEQEHRSYLTIAIGCTGGRHRSVYMVEKLAAACRNHHPVIVRHRTLGYQA